MLDKFAAAPDKPFIIWRDEAYRYGWLLEEVRHWQSRLAAAGVLPGQIVTVEGDYAPTTVALLLALLEQQAIIVPLTDSVEAHKPEFRQIAEAQVIIDFKQDAAGSITHIPATVTNPLLQTLLAAGAPGLVLFSSGSTGKSKAALHNFDFLLKKFQHPRHTFVTLTFLLLDHIGGINTLLYTLANTGTIVSIDNRDPFAVCRAIETHRVELLPTSPTFLNLLLLSEAYTRFDLSSLRRITYGTEVMPERVLARIHDILPAVELQQTYGLSELGILRSRSEAPDSLWIKVGGEGFETKIVDNILWIRAESAMMGYLNAPAPFDADGWFNTGDAVEVKGEYIKILGRRSEIINVGGQKVYPVEVESVLLALPNVRDVAVSGEANPITGQTVVARFNLIEPEPLPEFRKRMREFCRDRLAAYKIPARIEIVTEEQYSQRYKKMRRREV
ncbi:MAG: fatty acid--CoA ligase family protein [Anaerolineae bacterium]|nr:fatty acid--CoA ligase family protein [Anaerolineae bacterium]